MTCRNNCSDSTKGVFSGENRVAANITSYEKHEPLLEGLVPEPTFHGQSTNLTNSQYSMAVNSQAKFSENAHQSIFQQDANPNCQAIFGQNEVKPNNENGMLNSALMENLTALAKLDQLSSEQHQPADLPYIYQNAGMGSGEVNFTRSQSQAIIQRNSNNSGYQMGAHYPSNQRCNNQRNYHQQIQSNSLVPSDQQSALLQLAAIAAASEQQHSPIGASSQFGPPRGINTAGSSSFSMQGNPSFSSGMIERHRNMPFGGRGSPSFGQYGMDSMTHSQENMRFFRGK